MTFEFTLNQFYLNKVEFAKVPIGVDTWRIELININDPRIAINLIGNPAMRAILYYLKNDLQQKKESNEHD